MVNGMGDTGEPWGCQCSCCGLFPPGRLGPVGLAFAHEAPRPPDGVVLHFQLHHAVVQVARG